MKFEAKLNEKKPYLQTIISLKVINRYDRKCLREEPRKSSLSIGLYSKNKQD